VFGTVPDSLRNKNVSVRVVRWALWANSGTVTAARVRVMRLLRP
jgi:hypothetical protein